MKLLVRVWPLNVITKFAAPSTVNTVWVPEYGRELTEQLAAQAQGIAHLLGDEAGRRFQFPVENRHQRVLAIRVLAGGPLASAKRSPSRKSRLPCMKQTGMPPSANARNACAT